MCSLVKNKYPLEHVDIEVNHSCNLNCLHCSASASSSESDVGLDITQLKQILSSAQQKGLKRVGFTGGEPLMAVSKLSSITMFCKEELGLSLHMHTNGTLIGNAMIAPRGVLRQFESISVTFLGGGAAAHDEMAGQKGAFARTFEGARTLIDAGLPLTCYFVPSRGKCGGFLSLAEELVKAGVRRIRILALSPSGRARPIFKRVNPEVSENQLFEKRLLTITEAAGITLEAGCCTRLSMRSLPLLPGHEVCTSGVDRLHINHRGDVFPCTAASGIEELSIGNVVKSNFSFEGIWNDNHLLDIIRDIHNGALNECDDCSQFPRCQEGCIVNTCGLMSGSQQQYCPLGGTATVASDR